ncbi:MAG: nucleotidyltransferase family protein [Planctomycetia bacterium]|nr:nucleotidyltransferase family protein [Planctomycetia bacterium]
MRSHLDHSPPHFVPPDPAQELLLRAALTAGPEVMEAFDRWRAATGFANYADIDASSSRLLPLVYRSLTQQGLRHPWLPQMAGQYRYHWTRQAALQQRVAEAIDQLGRAKLDCLLVGGFALLASGCYADLAERPQLDAEIAVVPAALADIRRILRSLGWQATSLSPPVPGWRSEWWHDPAGHVLRVHSQLLPAAYSGLTLQRLLKHSCEVAWLGTRVHIPDAADQLLQACLCDRRGAWDSVRRWLWVVDAHRVLTCHAAQIDWQRLMEESRTLRSLIGLRESLAYLVATVGSPVPGDWLAQAMATKVSAAEIRPLLRSTDQPGKWPARLAALHWQRPWEEYAAAESAAQRRVSLTGWVRYWTWRAERALSRPFRGRTSRKATRDAAPSTRAAA